MCTVRKLDHECIYSTLPSTIAGELPTSQVWQPRALSINQELNLPNISPFYEIEDLQDLAEPEDPNTIQYWPGLPSSLVPQIPRSLQYTDSKVVFVEEYSTQSFLQEIRQCVQASSQKWSFVDVPMLLNPEECRGHQQADWLHTQSRPSKISLAEAILLVRYFTWATGCIVDLFDESELLEHLPQWIDGFQEGESDLDAIYCLIIAIGAQASPDAGDEIGRSYFNHGRYLIALHFGEAPGMKTAQCHTLMTWYLVCAARMTLADVHIASATQVAYALGLHRSSLYLSLEPKEFISREKLWKTIRVLDGFLSLALGRPSSIRLSRREATINGDYSACLDLCTIFESVITEVYAKRMVTTQIVDSISAQHRRWVACFRQGLEIDRVRAEDYLNLNGSYWPNIGLYHLKEAFYWTITLLTLPFLMDFVRSRILEANAADYCSPTLTESPASSRLVVDTCVSSAISTIELLQKLQFSKMLPKRLPFIGNSVFIAALTIGVAFFGDLDHHFPLKKHFLAAKALLLRLGSHDPVAERQVIIVGQLEDSCDAYLAQRAHIRTQQRALQIGSIFGVFSM